MYLSLRALYAAGEPFGDSATEKLPCGRVILGGGGSKSSSSTQTTSANTDRRLAFSSGVGISADNSSVNVQSVDSEIVKRALDSVDVSTANAGAGVDKLLDVADRLFTGAGQMVSQTQNAALAQLDTLNRAQNDAKGAIDQKTLVIIAIAGAAMVIVPKISKKGK